MDDLTGDVFALGSASSPFSRACSSCFRTMFCALNILYAWLDYLLMVSCTLVWLNKAFEMNCNLAVKLTSLEELSRKSGLSLIPEVSGDIQEIAGDSSCWFYIKIAGDIPQIPGPRP